MSIKKPAMEHPMPCSKCRKTFDAWGYTPSQRTRGPWRGLCVVCKEAKNLKGMNEYITRSMCEGELR